MRLLVAGADRVDAGKTTFSVGLVARLGATGFKPRAGNDFWFDHGDVRDAVADGRLYGKDARRLAEASPADLDPESINPVHRLWRPAPGAGSGLLGQADREFVVDRVAGSFVRNDRAEAPAIARDNLPLSDAVGVRTVDELNDVMARRHVPALQAVGQRILDASPAVVESYGDVARPLQDTLPPAADPEDLYDAVAVVEPERVRVYDGTRYARACAVASSTPRGGSMERRVEDVLKHLEPLDSVRLPPLEAATRTDPEAVASAYEAGYDAVVDVANRSTQK